VQQANDIIYQNLLTFEQHIRNATEQGAQLIVFNEYGLFGSKFNTRDDVLPFLETIPPPSSSSPVIPCASPRQFSDRPTLLNISCLAQKYSAYVVIDLGDLQPCNKNDTNCPADGRYQFNTLVAFSPDGELVARYHKMHLYQEAYYDASPLDPVYFDTYFGVRFGLVICFDLLFTDPSRVYFDNNITDVVFSTEWENVFPVISALQIQQSWARIYNANLLASGTGFGRISSGSGIYSQGNVLSDYFNPVKGTTDDRLLIAKVPKINSTTTLSPNYGINPLTNVQKVIPYVYIFEATPGSSKQSFVAKNGALSCTFSYSVSNKPRNTTEKYALIVYEAADIVDLLPAPFQYCGLVRCESEVDVCGLASQDYEASTVFDSFSISGNFNSSFTNYPLLFTANGQLLPPQKLTFDATTPSVQNNGEFGDVLLGIAMITLLSD
jgi:pantetheine hydrolase